MALVLFNFLLSRNISFYIHFSMYLLSSWHFTIQSSIKILSFSITSKGFYVHSVFNVIYKMYVCVYIFWEFCSCPQHFLSDSFLIPTNPNPPRSTHVPYQHYICFFVFFLTFIYYPLSLISAVYMHTGLECCQNSKAHTPGVNCSSVAAFKS